MKDKIVDFLRTVEKNFPECKLREYLDYGKNNYKKYYQPIDSNKQISALVKIGNREDHMVLARLMNVLLKRSGMRRYNDLIKFMERNKKDLTDSMIYKLLHGWYNQSGGKRKDKKCNRDNLLAQIFYFQIKKNIPKYQINNYLDLGCGSCQVTKILGKKLGLKPDNIIGADIESFEEQKNWRREKNNGYKFVSIKENEKLPFPDNHFSIISAFMVLHHIKNLNFSLQEIKRILQPGGYLFITEHDAFTYADHMLIDIEHALYMEVFTKKPEKDALKKYYGKYFDKLEWIYLLHLFGLEYKSSGYVSRTINFELQPTREFYAIFQLQI